MVYLHDVLHHVRVHDWEANLQLGPRLTDVFWDRGDAGMKP